MDWLHKTLYRYGYGLLAIAAVILVFATLLSYQTVALKHPIEWHDVVSEVFIGTLMLAWISIAYRMGSHSVTFSTFFSGCACILLLMVQKLMHEFYAEILLPFSIAELLFSLCGVTLVSIGLFFWSKDYRALIERLVDHSNHYRDLSEKDALTGLLNRQKFNAITQTLCRQQTEFTLILFDLDHFKRINDTYGHAAGDQVLKSFGDVFLANTRNEDYCFRLGGEEFALVTPSCTQSDAFEMAERIRLALDQRGFQNASGEAFRVTTSAGLCSQHNGDNFNEVYHNADVALYDAKHRGRNQVISFNS